MTEFCGSIPLLQVFAHSYFLPQIDNTRLAEEVLLNQVRVSDDPSSPLFEDTVFNPQVGSVGATLLQEVSKIAGASNLRLADQWSHIHYPRESTSLHTHLGGGNIAAFVYYVAVPEHAGQLIFEFDCGLANIAPKQGMLYIFPAWAKHRVTRNMSDKFRISISGNLQ